MRTRITNWLDCVSADLSPGASHLLKSAVRTLPPGGRTGPLSGKCRRESWAWSSSGASAAFPSRQSPGTGGSCWSVGSIEDTGRRGGQTGRVVLYRVTGALCDWDPDVSLKPGNAEERVDASAGCIKPAPWIPRLLVPQMTTSAPMAQRATTAATQPSSYLRTRKRLLRAPCTCGLVGHIMVTMGSCLFHPNTESQALFGTLAPWEPEYLGVPVTG